MEQDVRTPLRAWEKAYTEHRAAVYHTALSFIRDRDAAEDICHEVFLALYGEWEKGGRIRHLRAWLLTATRNRCANLMRDRRREELTGDDGVWDIPAEDDDELLVKELLGRLPPDERLVFCLHCLDGYPYRELAEGLSLPIGTVQTRVRSARKRLKGMLDEKEDRDEVSSFYPGRPVDATQGGPRDV